MIETDYPHPDDPDDPDEDDESEAEDHDPDDSENYRRRHPGCEPQPADPWDLEDTEEFYRDTDYTPSNIIDPSDRPTRGPDPYH